MPDLNHFDKYDGHVRDTAYALHEMIGEAFPQLGKMKRWGYPGFVGNSTVCTICCHSKHVNLQLFHGGHLADPQGLLEGTGKGMRHIKLQSAADLNLEGLMNILVVAKEYDSSLPDEGLRARAETI